MIPTIMSFFSNPGQSMKEALEARRERQREERREARRQGKRPYFGTRKNLHDHRMQTQTEDDDETSSTSTVSFKWRSISSFIPTVLITKDLEEEEDKIKNKTQDGRNRGPITVLAQGTAAGSTGGEGFDTLTTSTINDNFGDDDSEGKSLPGMKSHLQPVELGLANDAETRGEIQLIDRRDIPQELELPFGLPEDIPSEPLYYSEQSECWGPFRCHKFTVSHKLRHNYTRQSRFMKRVMVILSLQYMFVLSWVATVMNVPVISKPIVDNFNYSYIPLGICITSKILFRSMVRIRKVAPIGLLFISCFRILCFAYYFGAVAALTKSEIILLAGFILLLAHIFFTVSAHFVDYDVINSEVVGMAAVVNVLFSILMIFPFVIWKSESMTILGIMIYSWLPSFIISQLIVMLLIFDMKQIIGGWRFPLGEADWIFTVLYL